VSFTPPVYPYARLDPIRAIADRHDGGAVDCSIGTPNDPPAAFVLEALARGEGARGYPPSAGTAGLREAASAYLGRRFGVEVDAANVAACVGTKEFVASVAGYLRLRRPDRDTVLYPQVSYPTYAMSAQLAGVRSVAVPVKDGRLALHEVSSEDAARALVLWSNSPSNPTGEFDDLGAAAAWGRDHDVYVLSDECYAEYSWSGPPATILSTGSDHVLAVHSISKRSNLAGARVGFYAGDPALVAYLTAVRQHAGLMAAAPLQYVAQVAYGDDDHVEVQRARYRTRLSRLADALVAAGYDAPMPQGTFYLWVAKGSTSSWELAAELAALAGLVTSPGEFYGELENRHVRIAAVALDDRVDLVVARLRAPVR
jgi:succinyldiaminopimelate transaminase